MAFEELKGTAEFHVKLVEEAVKAIVKTLTANNNSNFSALMKMMAARH
jgi:hypothetical protein